MAGHIIKSHERHAPRSPGHTCPDIDDVIASMEKLRRANSELREAADYWQSTAAEIAGQLEEAQSRIDDLEEQLRRLEVAEAA